MDTGDLGVYDSETMGYEVGLFGIRLILEIATDVWSDMCVWRLCQNSELSVVFFLYFPSSFCGAWECLVCMGPPAGAGGVGLSSYYTGYQCYFCHLSVVLMLWLIGV